MKYYKICTTQYTLPFEKCLKDRKITLEDELKPWEKVEDKNITTYLFPYTRKTQQELLEHIGRILTEFIQERVLISFGKSYLKDREDLTEKEKKRIFQTLFLNHYMDQNQGTSYLAYYLIYAPLVKELRTYGSLNIEGWITFKTKAYKEVLKEVLEKSMKEYAVEKDYLEFILLLRENQKVQTPLMNTIHVIADEGGKIYLFDEEKQDQTARYYAAYGVHISKEEIKQEDKIMNILVSLSPKRIIIHRKEFFLEASFVDTIELIFLGKVKYCTGCKLCEGDKNH